MTATAANAITATNQGALVNILTWVFMVIMIMASTTKIANTWYRKRSLAVDDYLVMAAVVFAIGQTVAVALQVSHGLGDQDAFKEGVDTSQYEQASYASELLYIMTLHITKATTAYFTRSFAPVPWVKRATASLMYAHLAWTVVSLVTVAFQCHLPHPWKFYGNECIDVGAFWDVYAAIDILSDIALVVIPIAIVVRIRASKAQRLSIVFAFSTRLITIPLIVLRILFLNQTFKSGRPPGGDEVKTAVITEIHMHMAIVLTCLPFIKSVIDGLQGGVMSSDLFQGQAGLRYHNDHTTYPLSHVGKPRQKSMKPTFVSRTASTTRLHDSFNNSMTDRMSESPPSPTADHLPRAIIHGPNGIMVQTTITHTTEAA